MDLKVDVLLLSPDGQVSPTGNPLLYMNEDSQIVFLNFEDLRKFSVKFKTFKENYGLYPHIRKAAMAKVKEQYIEKQSTMLAKNLQKEAQDLSMNLLREVENISGSPPRGQRKSVLM